MSATTAAAVQRQLEFYFSTTNLKKDRFLQQQLADSPVPAAGWVPVSVVAGFNKMRKMTPSLVHVAACVHASADLVLGVGVGGGGGSSSSSSSSIREVAPGAPAPGTQKSAPYPRGAEPWVRRAVPSVLPAQGGEGAPAPPAPRAPLANRMSRLEDQLRRLQASAAPRGARNRTVDSPFGSSQALKILLRRIVRLAMGGEFGSEEGRRCAGPGAAGGAAGGAGGGGELCPADRLLRATLAALDLVSEVNELPQLDEMKGQVSALSASVVHAAASVTGIKVPQEVKRHARAVISGMDRRANQLRAAKQRKHTEVFPPCKTGHAASKAAAAAAAAA
jgi:hypothetical protein